MMENNAQVPDSIIRKIQLLFNLASQHKGNDGASNEAEASAAMAKAQELLAKYNLDIAVVGSTRVAGGTVQQEENREEKRSTRTAQYRWQFKLMKEICAANFCFHWVTEVYETERWNRHGLQKLSKPQRMKRHVILGKESNRTVVELMYGYLIDTIENILPYPNTERLSKSAQSWREGCVDRLCERITEKAIKMREVDSRQDTEAQSTALAIRSIHDAEYAANYDARYGKGAYAEMKARHAKWDEELKERQRKEAAERESAKALLTAGSQDGTIDADSSWEEIMDLLKDFPQELAEELVREMGRVKPETAAERKEREKQERQEARWNEQYWRRQEREAARIDRSAYRAGKVKAEDIGLDSQLKNTTTKSLR